MQRLNHYATGSQASPDFHAQKCFHPKHLPLHKRLFTVEHVWNGGYEIASQTFSCKCCKSIRRIGYEWCSVCTIIAVHMQREQADWNYHKSTLSKRIRPSPLRSHAPTGKSLTTLISVSYAGQSMTYKGSSISINFRHNIISVAWEKILLRRKNNTYEVAVRAWIFSWTTCSPDWMILIERTDSMNRRITYLRSVVCYRKAGGDIVYVDEAYVHNSHHATNVGSLMTWVWTYQLARGSLHHYSRWLKRWIHSACQRCV